VFAAFALVKGSFATPPTGALIYAGSSMIPIWYAMRSEWRRNRRENQDREHRDQNGGGRS
jgi:hypothetical protein